MLLLLEIDLKRFYVILNWPSVSSKLQMAGLMCQRGKAGGWNWVNGPLMDWSIRISSSIFASTNLFNQFSANSEPLNCNGLNTSYLLLSVTLTLRVIAADYFLIFYFLFITVSHSDCACDSWKLFATRIVKNANLLHIYHITFCGWWWINVDDDGDDGDDDGDDDDGL